MDRLKSMSVFIAVVEAGACRLLAAGSNAVAHRQPESFRARIAYQGPPSQSNHAPADVDRCGQVSLAACKRILEDVGEAERSASGEYSAPRGELIITAPVVFGRRHVVPTVAEFLKAYPEVDTRLVLNDRSLNLLEDHVDLAVRIGEPPDSSLVATRVGTVRNVVCASPAYLAERGTPRNPTELVKHDCLTFSGLMSPDSWMFTINGAAVSVPVHSRLIVNTAEAAIDAAIAGAGLTRVLSYQIEEAINAGALAIALRKFEPAPIPINLMYAGQQLLPLKLRAFLDFAMPRLRTRLTKTTAASTGAM